MLQEKILNIFVWWQEAALLHFCFLRLHGSRGAKVGD